MSTPRTTAAFAAWRSQARTQLTAGVLPEYSHWGLAEEQQSLFTSEALPARGTGQNTGQSKHDTQPNLTVPAEFMRLMQAAIHFRADDGAALGYRILWRLTHGERRLLDDFRDQDNLALRARAKAVTRDCHKMKAFVRFKELSRADTKLYVAWFEPQHRILELIVPFFRKRFQNMDWSLVTPDGAAHWHEHQLALDLRPQQQPELSDPMDELWQTYYRHIFNPARLKLKAMQTEMPKRYWKHLPEANLIAELSRQSTAAMDSMLARTPTAVQEPASYVNVEQQRLRAKAREDDQYSNCCSTRT